MTRYLSLIVGLLLFGLLRLVIDLKTYADLWVDEGWTVIATAGTDVTAMVASDVHPPLYFYLLYLWRSIAGSDLFTLRYFSLLAVLLTAVLLYRFGAYLYSRYLGVVAALLYLLHDLVWVLGREVRQYPLMQLFVVLTLFAYWRLWEQPGWRRALPFVIGASALLWTNYWGGFVLLGLALHGLLTRREGWRYFTGGFVAVGVSFIPWLPILYTQLTSEIPTGIGHALPASRLGYEILAFQLLGRPEWLWAGLAVIGGLSLSGRRWWWPSDRSLLLLLAVVVIVGLSVLLDLVYPTLSFRALSVVLPLLALLFAHAVTSVPRFSIVTVVAVSIISIYFSDSQPPERLPWQPIAQYVTAHSDDETGVLIETWFDTYAFTHYLEEADNANYLQTELQNRTLDEVGYTAYLEAALMSYDSLWVVRFSPSDDITPQLVSDGFEQTAALAWPSQVAPVDVWRFDRTSTSRDVLVSFGEMMQLTDYTITQTDQAIYVGLLWSAAEQPQENYVVSAFILNAAGQLITQHDAPPLDVPTTTWNAGELYFDAHTLELPPGYNDPYQVGVKVYSFTDDTFQEVRILPPDECEPSCEFVILEGM